jgi:hypothetical protein
MGVVSTHLKGFIFSIKCTEILELRRFNSLIDPSSGLCLPCKKDCQLGFWSSLCQHPMHYISTFWRILFGYQKEGYAFNLAANRLVITILRSKRRARGMAQIVEHLPDKHEAHKTKRKLTKKRKRKAYD